MAAINKKSITCRESEITLDKNARIITRGCTRSGDFSGPLVMDIRFGLMTEYLKTDHLPLLTGLVLGPKRNRRGFDNWLISVVPNVPTVVYAWDH